MGRTNGSIIVLDEIERSRSIPPIATIVEGADATTSMATRAQTGEVTKVPNWVFPILATVLFTLLGFVYLTMQKQIDQIRELVSTQEIWIRNTREQLIQRGWQVDQVTGQIHPPPDKGSR